MKKNVLVFGLISGVLISIWMLVSIAFSFHSMLLGYTGMVLALSLVFVGVKNYRDKHSGGIISFGKAFQMGLYIALTASTVYVIAWLIDYYVFIPDFMDKYSAECLRAAESNGATPAEMKDEIAEIAKMKQLYQSPVMVVLFTYLEILPVALIVPLVTALLLKRKSVDGNIAAA